MPDDTAARRQIGTVKRKHVNRFIRSRQLLDMLTVAVAVQNGRMTREAAVPHYERFAQWVLTQGPVLPPAPVKPTFRGRRHAWR